MTPAAGWPGPRRCAGGEAQANLNMISEVPTLPVPRNLKLSADSESRAGESVHLEIRFNAARQVTESDRDPAGVPPAGWAELGRDRS